MRRARALALRRELTHLEGLMARTPKSAVFGDGGLSARLSAMRSELADLEKPAREAVVELTFRGKPVVGDTAIAADFGGRVLNAFTRLLDAILGTEASASGLYVTAPARGSFGFRLEELKTTAGDAPSPLARAVERSGELLLAAASGEEKFDPDVKLLGPLKNFVTVVHRGGADVRLMSLLSERRLEAGALERAAERIRDLQGAKVTESTRTVRGILTGLRVGERDFEHTSADGSRIVGELGPALDVAVASSYFARPCTATIAVVEKVFPSGRTNRRETLLSLSDEPANDST